MMGGTGHCILCDILREEFCVLGKMDRKISIWAGCTMRNTDAWVIREQVGTLLSDEK